MAVTKKFWLTEIKLTIVSPDGPLPDDLSLEQLASLITYGDSMGDISTVRATAITAEETAKLAWEMGGDPSFFDLNSDGTEEVDPEF